MRRNVTSLVALLALIGVSSCSTTSSLVRERYCNVNGAYEKGVNDALLSRTMNSDWLENCDQQAKIEIQKKYQEGFVTALHGAPGNKVIDERKQDPST